MPEQDEKWKRYEVLLANFQSIGKAQSFYVNSLFGFLFLVWAVDVLHQTGGITIQILGVTAEIKGFWYVVPLVAGTLCLALTGSINLIAHAWRRLDICVTELFSRADFFFTEFDPHKNILDYIAALTLGLKKPILPDTARAARTISRKWNISLLLYPALVLFSIGTTLFAVRRTPWNWLWFSAICASTILQGAFSLPFILRKTRIFFSTSQNLCCAEGTVG